MAASAEGYTYDAVGNRLTSAGPTSYNYNASNELTSTSAATYTYDNNGNTRAKPTRPERPPTPGISRTA